MSPASEPIAAEERRLCRTDHFAADHRGPWRPDGNAGDVSRSPALQNKAAARLTSVSRHATFLTLKRTGEAVALAFGPAKAIAANRTI